MNIFAAGTARNPGYFQFVCRQTAHFANACSNHISDTEGFIWTPAFAGVAGFGKKRYTTHGATTTSIQHLRKTHRSHDQSIY